MMVWMVQLYFVVVDRELLFVHFIPYALICYSNDAPASLCNVEPIQVDPRCSPLHICVG